MGYFLVAICCGIASAMIASSKGRSAGGWFFLGLLLGPFGVIFAAIAGKEGPAGDERKCPFCAEFIKKEAVVCKHCGKDVSGAGTDPDSTIPCTQCGHENPLRAYKCEGCGHYFQD
ncbi:hypothetical protein DFW101_3511 [Solidesulfovibrio carbinoliphilus subsp. oakridgensis]|uniref:DZANK-type domain-containing protein n=1 Tax=Solidesulfovibrio carbinoliphilus subsp. oakridgensis TaxID=694327 RepID=G7QC61_9BACT|nr:zinc ribbon domain-containing protein [Solidesulfovibrio carbinoliphilus]EHJ49507.1 hypothetical protein DFW101_3511 [Solidesulfovibrio carbinoliphilus subsp. oakridgensis]